jgi:phage replication-related protein YjqB (UPF0714/DUF867 family)
MRLSILLLLLSSSVSFAADKYANFSELSAARKEGDDYTVTAKNRKSKITVMAIHGGAIEPHSEEMAAAVAENDFNLYTFVAAPKDHSTELHLTATHFDEPRALALAEKSDQCISMHGYLERVKDGICVGGGDAPLRKKMVEEINKLGLPITVEEPCAQFGGSAPNNIVNRCKLPGIQLEVSTHLRNEHAEWFKPIADAVRKAILAP